MSNLGGRPPLGQKAPKPIRGTDAAKAHMRAVAGLGCAVCGSRPVEVHHCISGRYGSRKVSDFDTLPLCVNHHRGADGIHTDKAAWEALHGPDTDYLPIVKMMINQGRE
jgi:hypothetical protein